MTTRILSILCAAMVSLSASGQNAAKARQILDKTATVINNKGGASARFTISGSKVGKTSGTISIKGNKFQATTPEASIWYNGKTQWTYMKDTEEVNVSTPKESQQAQMNPYHFINLYKSGYTLGLKQVSGQYEVHLTATNAKKAIKEMYILIHPKTYLPSKVRMLHNGKWTTIMISNFRASNLSDSMFSFNSKDFPEAEIIDLR